MVITKDATIVFTRWLAPQAPDVMEGWELRAGIEVIIFVVIVCEPCSSVHTYLICQTQDNQYFNSHRERTTYPSSMRCMRVWLKKSFELGKIAKQPSLVQGTGPSSRTRINGLAPS